MTTLWYSFRPLERLGGGGPSPFGFLTGFVAVVEAIKLEFYVNLTVGGAGTCLFWYSEECNLDFRQHTPDSWPVDVTMACEMCTTRHNRRRLCSVDQFSGNLKFNKSCETTRTIVRNNCEPC